MKITLTNVFVDDQDKAERFYTEVLGFVVKHNVPLGEHRWLTMISPEDPGGAELLLEPAGHPAVGPYRAALVADGIPCAQFTVDDVEGEYDRLARSSLRRAEARFPFPCRARSAPRPDRVWTTGPRHPTRRSHQRPMPPYQRARPRPRKKTSTR